MQEAQASLHPRLVEIPWPLRGQSQLRLCVPPPPSDVAESPLKCLKKKALENQLEQLG